MDRLIEMGDNVLGIDNVGHSEEPDKYYNLRSEIWCRAADADISFEDMQEGVNGLYEQ